MTTACPRYHHHLFRCLALLLAFLATIASAQTTLYVQDPSQGIINYDTIQLAVNAVDDNDPTEIIIAEGTYVVNPAASQTTPFIKIPANKLITLECATDDATACIIQGRRWRNPLVEIEEGSTVVMVFLTLQGHTNLNFANNGDGGAIYNLRGDLTLTSCNVNGNLAARGGGIFNVQGDVKINGASTVNDNTATRSGGGIFSSNGAVTISSESSVDGNSAGQGGGIFSNGAVTISGASSVNDNSAVGADADIVGDGGGILSFGSGGEIAINGMSSVNNNTALGDGGGIYTRGGGDNVLTDIVMEDNTAGGDGGAIAISSAGASATVNLVVTGSTFRRNGPSLSEIAAIGGGNAGSNAVMTIDTSTLVAHPESTHLIKVVDSADNSPVVTFDSSTVQQPNGDTNLCIRQAATGVIPPLFSDGSCFNTDTYFCPEQYEAASFVDPYTCVLSDPISIDDGNAEAFCENVIPNADATDPVRRGRNLLRDLQAQQATPCVAGAFYNWTTRVCEQLDYCIQDTSPCSAGVQTYCVNHDAPLRFECGCVVNTIPTGYPSATTTIMYKDELVEAYVEQVANESGFIFNYTVPIQIRPLGCKSIQKIEAPSAGPTTDAPVTSDGPCADFGRPCTDISETCDIYGMAEDNVTALYACLCRSGMERLRGHLDQGGCLPVDKCSHADWNDCDPDATCYDDIPGSPEPVRCECNSPKFHGGGRSCTRVTASPITPVPSPAPITFAPVAAAETKKPVSAPPPPCNNDCGFGDANRFQSCTCECDTEAVLVGGICVLSRRAGSVFDASGPNTPTCTFEACAGLDGYILVSTDGAGGAKTCMTVDFGGCDLDCAEAKCDAASTTSVFTPSAGVVSTWANPHTCVF